MTKVEPPILQAMQALEAALRQGDLAALPELAAQIAAAEAGLAQCGTQDLLRLRDLAERNNRSLGAARKGVRAARRRVAEVLTAARGLVTYDRNGQRHEASDQRILTRRL